jgi:hypothetical protein
MSEIVKEPAKFVQPADESLFNQVVEKMKTFQFNVSKKLDPATDINLYDINYMQLKLNVLESFDEGEFVLANRINIKRSYVSAKTQSDPASYDYVTRIHDVTIEKKRASIALIHGFAQCQDVFMEMALTLALNGFFVHMIDLEGSGYSAGNRINNLSIEKFHH